MQGQQQTDGTASQAAGSFPLPPNASPLLAGYSTLPARFDEAFAFDGTFRPRWQDLHESLAALGIGEFQRRWQESQRLIYDNSLAYSPMADPQQARPWLLDPLPLVIPLEQWQAVGEGLIQRARLLNLILADLYGPQNLIRQGVVPAPVVFRHPSYARPFHISTTARDSRFLHFYAADLVRAANGAWWVLADRTEAPSGAGFVLENRVVISRMLPEAFQKMHVRRLAPFFKSWQEHLRTAARAPRESPKIVLLSPGPDHPDFFEDAYLARYLGYTLAEGSDLAVRDSRVWLKTLEGLSPIDLIVRRPNSVDCDPLELGGSSAMGAAGLLQATRVGNVVLGNRLGSGLVESPVFLAFMPRLAHALLGEELRLPGVATWWCGEPKSLEFVLDNLAELDVLPAYRRRGMEPANARELPAPGLDQLRDKIRQDPELYVAQERVARSTVPVWHDGAAQPAPLMLRAFAAASGNSYQVLDGALARTVVRGPSLQSPPIECCKDAWIVGHHAVEAVTLLAHPGEQIALRRSGAELPSRVADNIFWMGRHLERADSLARLLRAIAVRVTSETSATGADMMPFLWRVLAEQGQVEPDFVVAGIREHLPRLEQIVPGLTFDHRQSGSLSSVVAEIFRLASMVRDRLSVDTWRIVKRIERLLQERTPEVVDWTTVLNVSNEIVIDLAAIGGMVMESMTRTQLFRFLDLGRRLERALQVATLLRCCFAGPESPSVELFEAVLEIADSLMTYRSRYLANFQLATVLDLLLTDDTNPRSIAYQLTDLERQIALLPRLNRGPTRREDERLILELAHAVRMVDVEMVAECQGLGGSSELRQLLVGLEEGLPRLSDAITHSFFIHTGPAIQVTSVHAARVEP